ncbi:MAG TPA: hypothetical protein VMH50_01880 [Thermoleophilia bacterium]|nr:hypothetical protein [Thermoleophilia bacterium]
MPFEEKMTWVSLVVAIAVPIWYFATMLGQLHTTAAADIDFQRPLIVAIVASVVLTVVGAIVMSIATSVAAVARGRKPEADIDRKDERDKTIGRRGDLVGYYVASAGMVGVLILTMLEADYFWIAGALYLSFVVAMVVSSVVKLVAYHRGF